MIHSLSGGVIKKYETKTLIKVKLQEGAFWFSCSIPVFVGDKAKTESGDVGEVVEVKNQVRADLSPVPFSQIKEIFEIIEND